MLGVLLDREMPRRNRVAPMINSHCTARVKRDPVASSDGSCVFTHSQKHSRAFSTTGEITRVRGTSPYATIPCPSTISERACRSRKSRTRRSITRNQSGGTAARRIIPA